MTYQVSRNHGVKLYADLSAAAFLKKQTVELSFWHCLRAINTNGCGYLLGRNLEEILTPLETFGYSPGLLLTGIWHAEEISSGVLSRLRGELWSKFTALRSSLRRL